MYLGLAHSPGLAINLNSPGTYLHWSFIDISLANLILSYKPLITPSTFLLDLVETLTGRRQDFRTLEAFPGWRSVPLHPAPPAREGEGRAPARRSAALCCSSNPGPRQG